MPRIFGGSYGLGSRDFRPEHIIGAYEFATAGRARKDGKTAADGVSFIVLGIDHPYAVIGDETPSLLPEGAVAVRFHSIGGWGAITTGKNLGAILGDLNDLLFERDGSGRRARAIPRKSSTSAPIPSTVRRRRARRPATSWSRPRTAFA